MQAEIDASCQLEKERDNTLKIWTPQKSNITVDWSDGQSEVFECKGEFETNGYRAKEKMGHTYNSDGEYQVTVLIDNSCPVSFGDNSEVVELDISGAPDLVELTCTSTRLKTLDVSNNIALKYLDCFGCSLKELNLARNVELETLNCHYCYLASLDVSKNVLLKRLNCYCNQLDELDVSKNMNLEELNCCDNQLTSLNLTNNFKLYDLTCSINQLKLDLRKNSRLIEIECNGKEYDFKSLSGLFNKMFNKADL